MAITNMSTEYDLLQIFQNLGKEYFGEDLSTERIGMFGFLTESFAHMYEGILLDSNMRSKEYSITTAMKRSTLNNEANYLGLNIPYASPANMTTYLGIRIDDLISFGKLISSFPRVYKLVIEKNLSVEINGFEFKPEYDIEITASTTSSDSYSYTAKYLSTGDTDYTTKTNDGSYYVYGESNVSEDIHEREIPCYRTGGDTKILILKIDLKQISKKSYEYSISDTNEIILNGIDFSYNDQYAYMNLYYKKSDDAEWSFITPFEKTVMEDSSPNVFYSISEDNNIISFDFSKFNPEYNSVFRIDIYSTKGSEPNSMIYSGDGSDIKVTLESVDNMHTYSGLDLAIKPISTSDTGKDIMSIEDLKKYIILNSSLINAVITEKDIASFIKLSDLSSDYSVSKYRNDIESMRYLLSSKIKNENGIIGTRCIDIAYPLQTNSVIQSGTVYNIGDESYKLPIDILKVGNKTTPYVSAFEDVIPMNLIDTNSNSEINLKIDHITISRSFGSDHYTIKASAMIDGIPDNAISNGENGEFIYNSYPVTNVIMLRGFIYGDSLYHIIKHVFNFKFDSYSDGIFEFSAELDSTPIGSSSGLQMTSNLYDVNDIHYNQSSDMADSFFVNGESPTSETLSALGLHIGIGCYYLEYDTENFLYTHDDTIRAVVQQSQSVYKSVMTRISDSANTYPSYKGICEYTNGSLAKDYIITDVYVNNNSEIDLYKDVSNIMYLDQKIVGGTKKYIDVPCLYNSIDYILLGDIVCKNILNTQKIYETLKDKLMNNFNITYKFYNTSGQSTSFNLYDINGNNTPLGNLNLNLKISIAHHYFSLTSEESKKIALAIKKSVENSLSEDGVLYLTKAVGSVANEFTYIDAIEFGGINDNDSTYSIIKYDGDFSTANESVSVSTDEIAIQYIRR